MGIYLPQWLVFFGIILHFQSIFLFWIPISNIFSKIITKRKFWFLHNKIFSQRTRFNIILLFSVGYRRLFLPISLLRNNLTRAHLCDELHWMYITHTIFIKFTADLKAAEFLSQKYFNQKYTQNKLCDHVLIATITIKINWAHHMEAQLNIGFCLSFVLVKIVHLKL